MKFKTLYLIIILTFIFTQGCSHSKYLRYLKAHNENNLTHLFDVKIKTI